MASSRFDCQKTSRNFADSACAFRRASHFLMMMAQETTEATSRSASTPPTTSPEFMTISR